MPPPPQLSPSHPCSPVGQDFGRGVEVGVEGWISRAIKPFSAHLELLRTAARVWSPDAMGTRYFLVGFLILLVLGFEVQGAHVPQQDEASSPALLTQVQESLLGYWDTAKAAAQKLYKKTYLPAVDEKIRDIYSKSTAAVTTYAGIITDQVFSVLSGKD
ncbi:apolipoprotein C-II isoform X1 [Bos taurus]|uniref:Apolipoprotein C-II n=1 Tax=Bos taurus TaxID=9913 RepID=A0AAF6Z7Y5_BOVIN|nr:apolipoprotein C-II isoform X1 [Bos taurus]